jgi:DNA-binding transcriptional LysR family regulator
MDVRRLRLLVELSRLGSMSEVAAELGTTTSNVSQGLAALARDVGVALTEPDGRRVRLTPAGRRLSEHAEVILSAVNAARLDLDPDAEPYGVVRVAGFATALRRSLLPAADALVAAHAGLDVRLLEHEPPEAFDLLSRDAVDLALVYDYDLAPATWGPTVDVVSLWSAPWGLGVPSTDQQGSLAAYAAHGWIVNSRNSADEDALRTLASLAGFTPRITHRIDSLELVEELISAARGVALLPDDGAPRDGVAVISLEEPGLILRAYALTRRGQDRWPPLRAMLDRLTN